MRMALKLATGAGKTTVMAMLLPGRRSTRCAGRGEALHARIPRRRAGPHDQRPPACATAERPGQLLPRARTSTSDLLETWHARIVITNYHAFRLRERMELSAGGRALLQGRTGEELITAETEGQMIQRVMPELMGFRHIIVLNDEAHHCYREKPHEQMTKNSKARTRQEAEQKQQSRTGVDLRPGSSESQTRQGGSSSIARVFDLSATPFFLPGSGYAEGTLFPWVMSDFSLMDAIECGIVKLPRVPWRRTSRRRDAAVPKPLGEHSQGHAEEGPRPERGPGPGQAAIKLQTALWPSMATMKKRSSCGKQRGIGVPPCFIIVCQNTAISKLVYDYVSGFSRQNPDGTATPERPIGTIPKLRPSYVNPYPRPENPADRLRAARIRREVRRHLPYMAADEIERFRREKVERTGDRTRQTLSQTRTSARGHEHRGQGRTAWRTIRCVVSVAMLTEGWDANR